MAGLYGRYRRSYRGRFGGGRSRYGMRRGGYGRRSYGGRRYGGYGPSRRRFYYAGRRF